MGTNSSDFCCATTYYGMYRTKCTTAATDSTRAWSGCSIARHIKIDLWVNKRTLKLRLFLNIIKGKNNGFRIFNLANKWQN